MILINFKIYQETFGDKAIELAKSIKEITAGSKTEIVITASALDAYRLKEATGLPIWLQNVDQYDQGKHTGWISSSQALALGIDGSLINHSEHQITKGTAQKIIKNKPENFKIICCAKSIGQIKTWVVKAKPDYILYEPPELIASSTDSVASKPESIKKALEACASVPLLVGAGIKSPEDVEVCLKMGVKSIGLSSALVLNKDPGKLLKELVAVFNAII